MHSIYEYIAVQCRDLKTVSLGNGSYHFEPDLFINYVPTCLIFRSLHYPFTHLVYNQRHIHCLNHLKITSNKNKHVFSLPTRYFIIRPYNFKIILKQLLKLQLFIVLQKKNKFYYFSIYNLNINRRNFLNLLYFITKKSYLLLK